MAAFGFRPVRLLNGSVWNGATVRHSVLAANANPIQVGDLVDLAGTASISPVDGAILSDLTVVTAGSPNYGVVTGILQQNSVAVNLALNYGAASTYREILVAVLEPNLVLECTANSTLVTSAISLQYDIVATTGSTGVSAMVLTSTPAATTGGGFQWVGVRSDPANLATLTSSSTTLVASTAAVPTVIEVVCVEPRVGLAVVTVGV